MMFAVMVGINVVVWVAMIYFIVRQKKRASASGIYQGGPGRSATRGSWGQILFLLAIALLAGLGFGGYQSYLYQSGTPARATIDHCTGNGASGGPCHGSWTVGGQSQTGRIEVGTTDDKAVGSQLDVRVRSGTAYTAATGNPALPIYSGIGLVIVGLIAIFRLMRRSPNSPISQTDEVNDAPR